MSGTLMSRNATTAPVRSYEANRVCPACPGAQPRNGSTNVAVAVLTPWDIRYSCQNCSHGWQIPQRWMP
jgi:hypothetical protein